MILLCIRDSNGLCTAIVVIFIVTVAVGIDIVAKSDAIIAVADDMLLPPPMHHDAPSRLCRRRPVASFAVVLPDST